MIPLYKGSVQKLFTVHVSKYHYELQWYSSDKYFIISVVYNFILSTLKYGSLAVADNMNYR